MNNIFFLAEKGILDGLWDGLGLFVEGLVRSIFYPICALVYKMIYYFYNIFEVLCSGQLLESKDLNMLFGRISLLLGVIMLFRVAFSFIQALIDPDTGLGDKEKGVPDVIKKVVIVIIMFGVSGYIFDLTIDIQALIIKNNVISKFLLPQQVNDESFGGALAANLFTTFYNIDPRVDPSAFPFDGTITKTVPRAGVYEVQDVASSSNICAHEEYYINGLRKSIKENNDYNYLKNQCLGAKGVFSDDENEYEFIIEFNFIFCLVVGIIVLWFLINYCLSVGIRVIQLTVLQLISPIAFIGYLEPKSDNMFKKWLKVYISTYIDVFIRMGIISFVCYICSLIMEGWNDGSGIFWRSVGNPTGFVAKVIGVFMILALFQFAKKAPDLLKSIFPTGSSGLSFGTNKEAFKPLGYGMRAATGIGLMGAMAAKSAISRRNAAIKKLGLEKPKRPPLGERNAQNMKNYQNEMAAYRQQLKDKIAENKGSIRAATAGGIFSGLGKGAYYGFGKGKAIDKAKKAFDAQVKADDAYDDLIAQGGNLRSKLSSKINNLIGETLGQSYTRNIKNNETAASHRDTAYDMAGKTGSIAGAENALNGILQGPNETEQHFRERRDRLQKNLDKQKDAAVLAAVEGKEGYHYEEKVSYTGFKTYDKDSIRKEIQAEFASDPANNGQTMTASDLEAKVNLRIEANKKQEKANFIQSLKDERDKFKVNLKKSGYNDAEIASALSKFDGEDGYIKQAEIAYDKAIAEGKNEIIYDIANSVVWETEGDKRRVNQIQAEKAKFDSHIQATGLQYYGYPPKDDGHGNWIPDTTKEKVFIEYSEAIEKYGAAEVFINSRKYADNTVAHIVSQPDYQAAIAADKSNGIDSSSTSRNS